MAPRKMRSLSGEPTAKNEPGRPLLGPSDSSDSGSDVAYGDAFGAVDEDAPVDVALSQAQAGSRAAASAGPGSSDAAGTGERRAAAGDTGQAPEAFDVWVDHIVDPVMPESGEALDASLLDWLSASDDTDTGTDEAEDGDAPGAPGPSMRR